MTSIVARKKVPPKVVAGQPVTPPQELPDLGGPVKAPTAPALVNQPAAPPSHTPTVDPVTGATTPAHGTPPPVNAAPPAAPAPAPTPSAGKGLGGPNGQGSGAGLPSPAEGTAYDPNKPTPKPDTSNDALDNALRDLNLSRIQGASNVDTTEAEGLIRELMQRQLGAQQVGQRASMGRAGFGSSGALAAMEGDAQQQAALGAQREILGLRRTEDQRAFDNAQDAAGTDLDYRRFGSDDEIRRAQLKALQDYLGLPGADAVGGDDAQTRVAEGVLAGANGGLFNGGVETETPGLASAGGGGDGMSSRTPIIVDSPPEGAQLVNENASFGGALYQGDDGKYYGVKG